MSISQPSDRFERATVHTADRMMAGHREATGPPGSAVGLQRAEEPGTEGLVRRQPAPGEEEEEPEEAPSTG